MKLFKGLITYTMLSFLACMIMCKPINGEIMSTSSQGNCEKIVEDNFYDNIMLTKEQNDVFVENDTNNSSVLGNKEPEYIEETVVESDISLDEFRDVLETSYDRIEGYSYAMSTYDPVEKEYNPSCREQLDDFSKEIYDGLLEFTESGKMLYGTESGTTSVSANSVLYFVYQTKEEAIEKINNGDGVEYITEEVDGKKTTFFVDKEKGKIKSTEYLDQFLYDTAYMAFAAFKWDHPEVYYLESNAFKFTMSGQLDETKTTVIGLSSQPEKKFLGQVAVTIEVANEKNGGKKAEKNSLNPENKYDEDYGDRYYYNSFINESYEKKILNDYYYVDDEVKRNTENKTKYILLPEETKSCILDEYEIIKKNKEKAYAYVEEKLSDIEKTGKVLTEEEKNIEIVKGINEWVCDNTYYNKYLNTTYAKLASPKKYEMSSVLTDLLPKDSTPEDGITGMGDRNAPICEGYSKAMKYMLSEYNIPTVLIAGYTTKTTSAYSGNHMWNGVKIGDKWYALDTTWNVSSSDKNAFTVIGTETNVNGNLFKDRHYPLGTFWAKGIGKIEFPELSRVAYGEVDPYGPDEPEIPAEQPKPNSFYIKDNNVYYYDAKCKKVTGFKTINGNKYYFNPSKNEGEDEYGSLMSGFFKVGKNTYYRNGSKDTESYFAGITKGYVSLYKGMSRITDDNAGYYYFNPSSGIMLKGFQNVTIGTGKEAKKCRFYFDETGRKNLGSNRKLIVNGKTYFVNTDGSMMSGLIKFKYTSGAVRLFYASNQGLMMTGLRSVKYPENLGGDNKSHTFYFKPDTGEAAQSELINTGSKVSYFNENYDREKLNGFIEYDGDYYYFKNSLYAQKGFAEITLKYEYVDELNNNKEAIRKYKYYFDKNSSKMAIGFTEISGKMYYFSEDPYFANESSTGTKGKMETGIVTLPKSSKDYVDGNTNTFYMLKNGGMFKNGLVTATKDFEAKDSQRFEYYFSNINQNVNGKNVRIGEAVGGYLSFDGKKLLKASLTYSKNTPYHFDENTGARRRVILYFHGGYYGLPVSDVQRDVMKSISSYGDADLNFGNNDIIFATMSDDYPVCASSYIEEEKKGQAVDMDGKLLSNDSRVIYNPANDYVNYNPETKKLSGGISGKVENDINEYGSNLNIVLGIKEFTYIEKLKIPDEDDIKYTVSFNVLNVERGTTSQSYVNKRDVYNFEGEVVKNEEYTVSYNKAVSSDSDGIVNVFDTESYCKAAYKWCIDSYGKENVVLVGASSGAGICMSLIQWAANTDTDLVAESTVLISPWLDASMAVATGDDMKRKGGGVDYETLCYWGKRYTLVSNITSHTDEIFDKGYDASENYYIDYSFASPVTVSERQKRNYVNLNDVYVFTGTKDACMNNGYMLSKECVKKSGTRIAYKCYSGESHGFVFNVNDSNSRYVIHVIANLKTLGL